MSTITAKQALAVLENADLLFTENQVHAAVATMAEAISARLAATDPLALLVMNGALVPASLLFMRMNFPLQVSYLHVTRYRGTNLGGKLEWVAHPGVDVKNRTVLVIDDILDEGYTLKAIINNLREEGAKTVYSAVLVNKRHDRKEDLKVDFIGLDVEDRYIFGCGMDYHEYWRNLPAIYAVKNS